jgi:mannose/cellobiose epimerase-like protein (N-acyl-D-glucosamine 2-epimerase family)
VWAHQCFCSHVRVQNPHMHMLEALLALYEATGNVSEWFMLLC